MFVSCNIICSTSGLTSNVETQILIQHKHFTKFICYQNLKLEKSSFAQIAIELCGSIILDIFGLLAHGSIMFDVCSSVPWVWAMDQG